MRVIVLALAFLAIGTSCSGGDADDTDTDADTRVADIDTGTSSSTDEEALCEDICSAIVACADTICSDADALEQSCLESCSGATEADVDSVLAMNCDDRNDIVCTVPGASDVCDCPEASTGECAEVYQCLVSCGDDQACAQTCFDEASPPAQQLISDMLGCLNNECGTLTDPDEFQDCADASCGREIDACFGGGGNANSFCLTDCTDNPSACGQDEFCLDTGGVSVCAAGSQDAPAIPPGAPACSEQEPCPNGSVCVSAG